MVVNWQPPLCLCATPDAAEFVATSIVDPLLPAFLFHLGSTPVLAALTQLEQWDLHPVGAHDFGSLAVTIAGGCWKGSLHSLCG